MRCRREPHTKHATTTARRPTACRSATLAFGVVVIDHHHTNPPIGNSVRVPSVQVQFTIDDRERGDVIATDLLERRLVACAQTVGPISSRYWWQGTINQSQEWLFLCKTTTDHLDAVIEHIARRHPYDVPEIVACDITGGFGPYLDWIAAETHAPPDAARS